jgi:hypothetical protein
MVNQDLYKLSDAELESCLTDAIIGVTSAQRDYESANDNLGYNASRPIPEISAKDLEALNDKLECARQWHDAVQLEKQRRRSV